MPDSSEKKRITAHKQESDHAGHRSRVRQRFLYNGSAGMLGYEMLEAMLMMVLPRRDVKPLAKKLLAKYKTVLNVISQPQKELENFPGLGVNSAISLRIFFESMLFCLKEQCLNRTLLASDQDLRNFVRMKLGVRRHECYMVVMLNSRNYLVDYHVIAEGTVDNVLNYSRNIIELIVNTETCKVLLVHNHPSGICSPSHDDIRATAACNNALGSIGIELIDHLIVTQSECFSFVDNGLLLNRKPQGSYDE